MSGVKIFRFEGPLLYLSYDYFRRTLIAKTGLEPSGLSKYAAGERRAHKPQPHCTPTHIPPPPPKAIANPVSSLVEEPRQQKASNWEDTDQRTIVFEHGGPQNIIASEASTSSNTKSSTEPQQLPSQSNIDMPNTGQPMNNNKVIESSHCIALGDTGGTFNEAYAHDPEWTSVSSTCRPALHQSKSVSSGVCSSASDACHLQMTATTGTSTIDMASVDRAVDEEASVNGVIGRQLVLDCSSWSSIDYTALEQLVEVGVTHSFNLSSLLIFCDPAICCSNLSSFRKIGPIKLIH